jgi:hypothetical protein
VTLAPTARRALDALGSGSPWPLIAPLTAAYVLAYLVAEVLDPLRVPIVQAGLVAAAGAVLVWPALGRRPWVWWAMAALMASALWSNWMVVDNHVFLATYWLVAIAAARSAPEGRRARSLALAASALLGLTMLFATIHKLRAPEFLSGDFFHLTFLTEARFAPLGWVMGEDLGQIALANSERLAALEADPTQGPVALVTGGSAIQEIARTMSVAVLAFEGLLAVVWLARSEGRYARRIRHCALLAFALSTYAIAPVPGFGGMLVILGLADTRPGEGVLRAGYLVVLLHVLFGAAALRTLLA